MHKWYTLTCSLTKSLEYMYIIANITVLVNRKTHAIYFVTRNALNVKDKTVEKAILSFVSYANN